MRHTLLQSFQFAGRGLRHAFWSQRTMRVHTLLACGVVAATMWLRLSPVETAIVILAMVAVLAAELMNTAVETLVDLQVGDDHHVLAGQAKDLSAAAVLVAAGGAAIVGLLILLPPVVQATGMGQVNAITVGQAAALLGVLGLAITVFRRAEDHPAGATAPRAKP